jgi:hypothetical protein
MIQIIAKKAAAMVEALIWQHRTLESYAKIKQVTKPGTGGGLQCVDMPKHEEDGTSFAIEKRLKYERFFWR